MTIFKSGCRLMVNEIYLSHITCIFQIVFQTTIKSYCLNVRIKTFDLIPDMGIITGRSLMIPFKGTVEAMVIEIYSNHIMC